MRRRRQKLLRPCCRRRRRRRGGRIVQRGRGGRPRYSREPDIVQYNIGVVKGYVQLLCTKRQTLLVRSTCSAALFTYNGLSPQPRCVENETRATNGDRTDGDGTGPRPKGPSQLTTKASHSHSHSPANRSVGLVWRQRRRQQEQQSARSSALESAPKPRRPRRRIRVTQITDSCVYWGLRLRGGDSGEAVATCSCPPVADKAPDRWRRPRQRLSRRSPRRATCALRCRGSSRGAPQGQDDAQPISTGPWEGGWAARLCRRLVTDDRRPATETALLKI